MQVNLRKSLCFCLVLAHLFQYGYAFGAATDISLVPMDARTQATPNMIFGLDDSGSTDWEILASTTNGTFWWSSANKYFATTAGVFNGTGGAGAASGDTWFQYAYLFPNGSASDARNFTDSQGYYAVPPIPAFAFARSADYNPMYYNPTITYNPWPPGYISAATRTFPAATPTAARSHPWFPTSGTATTQSLTANFSSTTSDWTFRMVKGMTVPNTTTVPGITARKNGSGSFVAVSTAILIGGTDYYDVMVPFYPATYYVKDASCTSAVAPCFAAPESNKYVRRYEIKSGNSFPGGRTYAAELQNFANWYTFYRKRAYLLVGGMGTVLAPLKGLRAGAVSFNSLTAVTMYDFASSTDSTNVKALLGKLYQDTAAGGTPTRDTVNYIGQQYKTNTNIIQYGCQRNAAFILTDGFANMTTVTVPAYDKTVWMNTQPYKTVTNGSIADIAGAYFTLNLRTDLPTGLLSVDPTDSSGNADLNTNLHMNTYGIVLNSKGTIYGSGTPAAVNPFLNYPTWPTLVGDNPTMLDDLWHATINGRGKMFTVSNLTEMSTYLQQVIADLLTKAGADAGVAVSNVNIKNGDNTAYVTSYNAQNWSGELAAYPVDVSTGTVSMSAATQLWAARDQLTTRGSADRNIVTYSGNAGIPFQTATISGSHLALLNTPSQADNADVLAWLRGDRTKEGAPYRSRTYLLGDLVDAEPVFVPATGMHHYTTDSSYNTFVAGLTNRPKMVYQAANDGMLHAFNATTGAEAWAYVPLLAYANLNAQTSTTYTHQFSVDGTPTASDIQVGSGWKTILVGGLRAGGNGYYALNITDPAPANEAAAAANVLWEFPNASTSTAVKNNVGLSFGKPVIAKTGSEGWVVLVTSGYNNSAGDGQGHLFVLNADTGVLIKDIPTGVGTSASPSGLAQIAARVAHGDATGTLVDFVYGGDLQGNLWRFDLSGVVSAWNVKKLATLLDGTGTPQPISTTPQLTSVSGGTKHLVVVGTGALLGQSDVTNSAQQSLYGLVDSGSATPTISPLRNSLQAQTVTIGVGSVRNVTSSAVDYGSKQGWYFDLAGSGERSNTDLSLAFGALVFTTNQPSAVACSSTSYLYNIDVSTGGQFGGQNFGGSAPYAGRVLGNTLTSRPLIVVLPSGRAIAITHRSDTAVASSTVPLTSLGRIKRVAWKEVVR